MVRPEFTLMSPPCPVFFAGFETTTTRLQQAGWQLAAEQDIHDGTVQLLMRHADCGLYLVAESQRYDFFGAVRNMRYDRPGLPRFTVRQVARAIETCLAQGLDFARFEPIDAAPQRVEVTRQRIEDFALFAAPLVRTEEIIVEPQSVTECLDLIRRLQAPELAEIRKRNAALDFAEARNQTKFHAQILSLAA